MLDSCTRLTPHNTPPNFKAETLCPSVDPVCCQVLRATYTTSSYWDGLECLSLSGRRETEDGRPIISPSGGRQPYGIR